MSLLNVNSIACANTTNHHKSAVIDCYIVDVNFNGCSSCAAHTPINANCTFGERWERNQSYAYRTICHTIRRCSHSNGSTANSEYDASTTAYPTLSAVYIVDGATAANTIVVHAATPCCHLVSNIIFSWREWHYRWQFGPRCCTSDTDIMQ